MERKLKIKIIRNTILAILAVVAINFFVLYSLNFPSMALFQIKKYWILLTLLIIGFGAQIGLYTYLRHINALCSVTTMTSGGVSSISMLLCCSHYLLNILPFISASFASFLTKYTLYILLIGIISNVVGILIMIKKIKNLKGGVYE